MSIADYCRVPAEQVLDLLERFGRIPHIDLIQTCLERRQELTPGLLRMLQREGDETWNDDDPR